MEIKKKKETNNNRKVSESKSKLSDILLKKNHIENYINYSLKENENSYKQNKINNMKDNKVDKNALEIQLKKLTEHLYSLKFKLEKEKKKEKKKKHCIINNIDEPKEKDITTKNRKDLIISKKNHDITERVFPNDKLVHNNTEREISMTKYIPELIKTIEIYKNRTLEEQRNKKYIIEKYENILRNIKKQHIDEISEIKNNILEDVDFLIQKYRKIALELLEITKKKEKEKKEEQKKITEVCINACKKFEEDVKNKAKISLEEYKSYMLTLINNVKKEKEALEKKINELKKKTEEEKCHTEKRVFHACENKIKEEHNLNKELKNRLVLQKEEQNVLINNIYSKVDKQIKIYEENIIKIFHNILINNNINMSISELCNCIKDTMDEQYKNDDLDNSIKNQDKVEEKLKIKYGFVSVFDK
ncbi:conserved Plasmodium protein, unknown function [Plasmodium gallinaceum]|uniref:Uncharacterized protein n=1 Tax=Plasmodium gallinaceum TaxID=5849 RepID=A0A1J1GN97_PLAGA|nr:conserved Plasmodium protein, unknown function [Plasmodium gallinaceum]CRG93733.1 conserved Plasmodium protein, unknown function [Plasmodium gallinaceum]